MTISFNVYATAMVEKGMVSLEGDIEVGDKLKVFTKEGEERVLKVEAMKELPMFLKVSSREKYLSMVSK